MSSEAGEFTPYNTQEPGNLISARDWNDMQVEVKKDIAKKIEQAVHDIQSVPHADNADKLENKSAKELSEEIINAALQQIAKRTGYLLLFKRLEAGETRLIKHDLKAFPLVDVYTLDPFRIVYTEDGDEKAEGMGYFFLYNAKSEQRLRVAPADKGVDIEKPTQRDKQFKIPWCELLALYGVEYDDSSSLANLEGEFWNKLFDDPNDRFIDDEYFHSPWFSRCCGEGRTIAHIKRSQEWDDLYLKMVPRKTINTMESPPDAAPDNIEVVHYDFNSLGLTYQGSGAGLAEFSRADLVRRRMDVAANDVAHVMVLLKV